MRVNNLKVKKLFQAKKLNNTKKYVLKRSKHLSFFAVISILSIMQLLNLTSSVAGRFHTPKVIPAEPVKLLSANQCTTQNSKENLKPTHISITKAGINLPVVTVALIGGTWKVNEGVANYASETSTISEKGGNVGIFAHDKENGFSRIKMLQYGDVISVSSGFFEATYKVTMYYQTSPTNVETFYPSANSTLTLVTCDGIFSDQRYVVKAELVSLEKSSCYATSL